MPLVQQSWRISGDADYLLKCVARNVEGMHQQLLQFAAMPEVRNIRTFPVLGVAKDAPLPIPDYLAGCRVHLLDVHAGPLRPACLRA